MGDEQQRSAFLHRNDQDPQEWSDTEIDLAIQMGW